MYIFIYVQTDIYNIDKMLGVHFYVISKTGDLAS